VFKNLEIVKFNFVFILQRLIVSNWEIGEQNENGRFLLCIPPPSWSFHLHHLGNWDLQKENNRIPSLLLNTLKMERRRRKTVSCKS